MSGALAQRAGIPALGTLALVLGIGSLVVGAAAAIAGTAAALSDGTLRLIHLLPFLPLACWGYGLRFARWHLLIKRAVPKIPIRESFRAQAIGFALSVTPGRIAELWKLYLVEKATGEPAALGGGAMVVERATDLIGFTALAPAAGLLALPPGAIQSAVRGTTAAAIVAAGLVGAIVARPFVARRLSRVGPSIARQLVAGGDAVVRPVPVVAALVCLMLGRLGDGLLLWGILAALGHPVAPAFAVFCFASAGLVGGISLLPGGLGAAELTMAALMATGGIPTELGLIAAFGTRALILWIWVAFGMILFAMERLGGRARRRVVTTA